MKTRFQMSEIPAASLKYLKTVLCCCKWGYEELQGISQQAQLNYDEVKTNVNKCNADWRTLQEETKRKLESVIIEYSPYIRMNEEAADKGAVVKRSEQLSVEFEELRKRHYKMESMTKVDNDLVQARCEFFQKRLSRINFHGRNAAIATAVLGAIVGAIVAWRVFKSPVPIVLGALIGLVAAGLIAAVILFIFQRVTKDAVTKWDSLHTNTAQLSTLKVFMAQKASEVQEIVDILHTIKDDVMFASMTLVDQAKLYLKEN